MLRLGTMAALIILFGGGCTDSPTGDYAEYGLAHSVTSGSTGQFNTTLVSISGRATCLTIIASAGGRASDTLVVHDPGFTAPPYGALSVTVQLAGTGR